MPEIYSLSCDYSLPGAIILNWTGSNAEYFFINENVTGHRETVIAGNQYVFNGARGGVAYEFFVTANDS